MHTCNEANARLFFAGVSAMAVWTFALAKGRTWPVHPCRGMPYSERMRKGAHGCCDSGTLKEQQIINASSSAFPLSTKCMCRERRQPMLHLRRRCLLTGRAPTQQPARPSSSLTVQRHYQQALTCFKQLQAPWLQGVAPLPPQPADPPTSRRRR